MRGEEDLGKGPVDKDTEFPFCSSSEKKPLEGFKQRNYTISKLSDVGYSWKKDSAGLSDRKNVWMKKRNESRMTKYYLFVWERLGENQKKY